VTSREIGYYEFCPLLDSAFGPFLHRGRGRLTTREHAIELFKRWRRRFGPGSLFYTPVYQESHTIKCVPSEPVTVE
jgi:hypothetical protein